MTGTLLSMMDSPILGFGWDTILGAKNLLLMIIGFSLVIFVHELGHFLAAKWCDVRVDRFAIGFGKTLFAWRKGIGFRWGSTEEEFRRRRLERAEANQADRLESREKLEPSDADLARAAAELGLGETEYCFNVLPVGGYVKMLGQEDFAVDKSGELMVKQDPRAFTHKPIPQRMIIVSAGVVMNIVFAAVVFMIVFMAGRPSLSAEVGTVLPGSPAHKAGIMPGDSIQQINGRDIADRDDLVMAVMLSDPDESMKVEFDRKDPITGAVKRMHVEVPAVRLPGDDVLKLGVASPLTLDFQQVWPDPALPPEQQLQKGDQILAANGRPIKDMYGLASVALDALGDWIDLTVKRPAPDGKGAPVEKHVKLRAKLGLGQQANDDGSILGFVPRAVYNEMLPPEEVNTTELKRGDTIVRWGGVLAPRMSEIRKSIEENRGKEIPVTVLRDDREQSITVRPRESSTLRKTIDPLLVSFQWVMETERVVLADVLAEGAEGAQTPAAAIKDQIPRGSVLTRVNDEPVATWPELIRRLIKLWGTDVKLSWVYEGSPEQSGTIHVPRTLDAALGLPPSSIITSIDGREHVEAVVNGRRELYAVTSPIAQRTLLKELMGKTVKVEYANLQHPETHSQEVTITPDMLTPWTRQINFSQMDVDWLPKTIVVRETNPIKAMKIGIWKTYYFIEQCYVMGKRMLVSRTVSMDQVSGPIGIFRIGVKTAEVGLPMLLYFLALISANLAVINFLPLPIVDGGLFVFLLIEWIKGRPVSLKVQVATQMIGLALIIGVFFYVTFLDITKL